MGRRTGASYDSIVGNEDLHQLKESEGTGILGGGKTRNHKKLSRGNKP